MITEFNRGDVVIVPVGTEVRSMNPARKGVRAAGRTYRVRLWSTHPERETCFLHHRTSSSGSRYYVLGPGGAGWREMWDWCRDLGFDYPYGTDPDLELLAQHLHDNPHPKIRFAQEDGEEHIYYIWNEAKAVWAGSGGYWCEAPLAALKKL